MPTSAEIPSDVAKGLSLRHPQAFRARGCGLSSASQKNLSSATALKISSTTQASKHSGKLEEVIHTLNVDPALGLSTSEALRRLEHDGPNQLPEGRETPVSQQLLRQFADITVIALFVAAGLALVLALVEKGSQSWLARFGDTLAIFAIVLLNAVIGFFQERKAERALRALRKLGAPEATVLRDGKTLRLSADQLVVGDLLLLRDGDRVAADGRLWSADDLKVTEAALTGESLPVSKKADSILDSSTPLAERDNMVFMGTHVIRGRARVLVTATGQHTELGQIAGLLEKVQTAATPLQRSLQSFGRRVVVGCAIVGAVVLAVGLLRLDTSLGFLLLTSVSLAVAAIPEGLPAITTIVLALGVGRMALKHALIRRLSAVETLGCATRICTDKTGTLTQNKMSVRRLYAGGRELNVGTSTNERIQLCTGGKPVESEEIRGDSTLAELVLACGFAPSAELIIADNGQEQVRGNPTDAALLALHTALFSPAERASATHPISRVIPFDRQRRMSTVIVQHSGHSKGFTHGAPESVLARVTAWRSAEGQTEKLNKEARTRLATTVEKWAHLGLRVLALASAERPHHDPKSLKREQAISSYENEMTLIGFVGLADPPRAAVPSALRRAKAAGVVTVMITGDHPRTAEAIAQELGIVTPDNPIDQQLITGSELDNMSQCTLAKRAPQLRVVARATAANKLRLVKALLDQGQIVAMTGDGVNDAPAIKAASIGIAMGRAGTDVTREVADMVLLDDNYATMVSAIEEGRIIYSNIKRFIIFLFSVNCGLVVSVLSASLLAWPPIMTPTQILWINLITNGLPALALGMEPVHLSPMRQAPRRGDAPLVERKELIWLLAHGFFMALLGLGIFWYFRTNVALARTATFTVLAIGPLFHALNARSLRDSVFSLGLFRNGRLWGAFAAAFVLQSVAIYAPWLQDVFSTTPLSLRDATLTFLLAASVWLIGELEKLIRRTLDTQLRK